MPEPTMPQSANCRSDIFHWFPRGEVYHFNSETAGEIWFHVDLAKWLIKRSPRDVEIFELAWIEGVQSGETSQDKIDNADVSIPIIAVLLPDMTTIIIDGWSRIEKARQLGLNKLLMVRLNPEESKTVTSIELYNTKSQD